MAAHKATAQRDSRKATLARFAAVVASLFLVGLLIVTQSRAAFTATTDNTGNAFEAATIALSTGGAAAMFTVPPYMVPGDVVTGCLTVTYTGTADPVEVKIYQNAYLETDGAADGADLDTALSIDIDTVNDCTTRTLIADVNVETLVAMAAHSNYSNGISTGWDPAVTLESTSFLFTATFTPDANDNTRIGDGINSLTFTWETQAGA